LVEYLVESQIDWSVSKGGDVDLDDTPQQAEYRTQVRGWLEAQRR